MNRINSIGAGGAPAYFPVPETLGAEGGPGNVDAYVPPQETGLIDEILGFAGSWLRSIFSGPLGCAPAYQVGTVYSSSKNPEIRLRIDMAGDPAVGTVYHIRQFHLPPPFLSDENPTLDTYETIGAYHKEMLGALEGLKQRHIFVEGLAFDIPANIPREQMMDLLRRNFPEAVGYLEKQDPVETRHQKDTILTALIGADFLYAFHHPEVTLHKTLTLSEAEFTLRKVDEIKKRHGGNLRLVAQDPEFLDLALDRREDWATREMIQFLKEHPGESLVLVYGGAHRFCDDFVSAGLAPRMISVWWKKPGGYEMPVPSSCF
ncbi:hypothetical protein FBR05_09805 [Deltaproteobacteria bacterium PRO3]|nr:hypothetical protein [Deltaproteobacteria bacterium PRO3]